MEKVIGYVRYRTNEWNEAQVLEAQIIHHLYTDEVIEAEALQAAIAEKSNLKNAEYMATYSFTITKSIQINERMILATDAKDNMKQMLLNFIANLSLTPDMLEKRVQKRHQSAEEQMIYHQLLE